VLYDGSTQTGTGDRISDRLDEATTMLVTWARAFTDDRPHLPRPMTLADAVLTGDIADAYSDTLADDAGRMGLLLCAAFEAHLTSLATLDWCGEFVRDLGRHAEILRSLTEVSIPGWYAGACGVCDSGVYVVPGLTWVTCQGCGATTHAADHLPTILEEASSWVAPPKRIAEAVVAMVDTEASVPKLYDRIRQWAHRGDLTAIHRTRRDHVWSVEAEGIVVGTVNTGPARYRLGDVLDLIQVKRETRRGVQARPSRPVPSGVGLRHAGGDRCPRSCA
jgi:hypothetical protein